MSRPKLFALIGAGIVVFLLITALLTHIFSVDNAERSAVTSLIQAEAKGDDNAMLALMHGCKEDIACRERVAEDAARMQHRGHVSILTIQSSAGFSLTGTTGAARVAWTVGSSLPIVQCVRVRRAGNVVSGFSVQLLAITSKLKGDATCPSQI
ncbi:MAG TPA: hypothetical protein VGI87_13325 [Solirubrobacteraceae bacterium]